MRVSNLVIRFEKIREASEPFEKGLLQEILGFNFIVRQADEKSEQ
jgi:hypothetical protein